MGHGIQEPKLAKISAETLRGAGPQSHLQDIHTIIRNHLDQGLVGLSCDNRTTKPMQPYSSTLLCVFLSISE